MRSYLSLIPISARVRRRQNRMTLLCIIFAVFLVTAVFSMADMEMRMEMARLTEKHSQEFTFQTLMDTNMGQNLFLIAGALFVLILIAGVLMISGSINSTVAQRTEEFATIPLFGISLIGIISGIIMGTATVLLAARAPAKRAAKVSPILAVSGNSDEAKKVCRGVRTGLLSIDISLGIHHAREAKKNLFLMTGSFALSIILFLTFTVLLDFVGYLLPQSASASDINIISADGANSIPCEFIDTVRDVNGVDNIFGRRSLFDVSAALGRNHSSKTVDLISYGDFDLEALKKDHMLKKGSDLSKVCGDNDGALIICDENTPLAIGDSVQMQGTELTIAGMLKYDIFSEEIGRAHV